MLLIRGSEKGLCVGHSKIIKVVKSTVLLSLAVLFLTACGNVRTGQDNLGIRQKPANKMFDMVEVALTYIDRMHVRQIPIDTVAISGLNQLTAVDPHLRFSRGRNGLVGQVGSFAREYPVENPRNPVEWARVSVLAIESAKSQSPNLARLPASNAYELMFKGYEANLDRFSRYLEPREVSKQDDRFLGFGGLGVTIDHETAGIRITSVRPRSPAERAGLLRGDLINGVNQTVFRPNDKPDARLNMLKGPIGSKVSINYIRRGRQARASVIRDEVIAESVDYELKDLVAHIAITTFNRNTAKRVEESLRQAQVDAVRKGQSLRGVVLDVRDNGGGLRSAVVDVADIFLANSLITKTRGRVDRANKDFSTERPDVSRGLPLAVLINEGSASASELLAAGLQDNGRAIVIGSTSFGKGSVQSKLPLPNDGELALTTAEFFGPSGAPLHQYGVVPTICTSDNVASVSQVLNSIRSGHIRIAAAEARRAMLQNRGLGLSTYRDNCPPSAAMPNRDFNIASALLSDQTLYTRVLRSYANMQVR